MSNRLSQVDTSSVITESTFVYNIIFNLKRYKNHNNRCKSVLQTTQSNPGVADYFVLFMKDSQQFDVLWQFESVKVCMVSVSYMYQRTKPKLFVMLRYITGIYQQLARIESPSIN